MKKHLFVLAAVPLLAVGACGGGSDDADELPVPIEGDTTAETDAGGDGGSGEVTLTTDPGTAYAEVDGERFEYESSGSLSYTCEVGAERIQVNFQTSDGQDLSLRATRVDGAWSGQLTFKAADDGNTQYSGTISGSGLGVGDDALSYEGPVDRIEDFDVAGAEELDAEVAVNCASGGGDAGEPTAEIDGESYSFPFSGAQSVTCEVAEDEVDIRINRLSLEDLQLAIDMTGGPDDWLGSVMVVTPEGSHSVTLSGDAEGFAIDGDTVTYEGPIELDGVESDAVVSVTCP